MTRPADDLAYWLEVSEARAWGDFVGRADELGPEVHGDGETTTFLLRAVDVGLFNRSIGLGVGRPANESDVDAIVETFRAAGRQHFALQVSPLAQPSALESWLEARGLRRGRRWAKVWRGTDDPPPERTDLRIEQIGRDREDDWASVCLEGYELPPLFRPYLVATLGEPDWHHFMAFDGDVAVGAGAMKVMGDVAWLGFGATREAYRGRGAQSSIFARRIREARDVGVRLCVTETGEETADAPNPSYRNMIRSGFRLAYPRQNWIEPASHVG